jgi:hypothetical protein
MRQDEQALLTTPKAGIRPSPGRHPRVFGLPVPSRDSIATLSRGAAGSFLVFPAVITRFLSSTTTA